MPLLNQEEPKTTFELENGKKYNVGNEHIEAFIAENPNATTIMEREGKKRRVRASDYKTFNLSAPQEERAKVDNKFEEIDRSLEQTSATTDAYGEYFDNMQEYGVGFGQTKESKPQFNPKSGKFEKIYLTPQGNRHTDKSTADMESFNYRTRLTDLTTSGQLQKSYKRLEELRALQQNRSSEITQERKEIIDKNNDPYANIMSMYGGASNLPIKHNDKENRALSVAIRQTEETIKTLEEQRDRDNGIDVGFWRGAGRVAGDIRTWDFGIGDLRDATTMLDNSEPQTEREANARNAMLEAKQIHEQTEQQYSGNASFWNRAGMMAGHMPAFMLDFAISGGGFKGLSIMSKVGTKLATKAIGKEAVEAMVKQGLKSYIKDNGFKDAWKATAGWTIKALGTTADDLLVRAPLMTNTIQGAKTASDIIDRKLGDIVESEDGTLKFENDRTWSDAIWQGEANAIIENYSEMFGAHLDPVLSLGNLSKLTNVIGAKRLSSVLAKADAGALHGIMGATNKMFNKMGVGDYFGEVTEEYYGQVWRTMLNLDDAYQQNPDGTRTNLLRTGQFHGDIWGGMALTMGLMGVGKAGVSASSYYSMKHDVNKADATANEMLGAEVWEPLRATIDNITNNDIGGVAEIIESDPQFTAEERESVLDYMERSLNLRGFNLATMAQSRSEEMSDQDREINESYTNGYNIATTQEMVDANNMLTLQSQRLKEAYGDDAVDILTDDPIGGIKAIVRDEFDNEKMQIALDFINAKQIYNGMIQRVRDDIDSRISQSNAMIASRTNKTTGAIQGATLKIDDRKVHIVSGSVTPYQDGTGIDIENSDKSLIVRDAESGKLEQISPDAILNVDESVDSAQQRELATQTIREQYAQEAADKIDGTADFSAGASYTIIGENGEQINIQITPNEQGVIDNGDGTINVSDGAKIFPVVKQVIQDSANAANMARVVEFEQQRLADNTKNSLKYHPEEEVTVYNKNGAPVKGVIREWDNGNKQYIVDFESYVHGKMVSNLTPEELDDMVAEYNGQTIGQAESERSTTPIEQPTVNEEQSTNEGVPPTALEQEPSTDGQSITSDEISFPLDKNGEVDFDNLTPEQNFEWVKRNEGLETAINDLIADVSALDKNIAKEEKKLSNLTGGKRTKQRIFVAELKEQRAELERLLPPAQPTQQATTESLRAEDVQDQDYFDEELLDSEDVVGLADAYEREKALRDEFIGSHWSQHMTAIRQEGFERFGDKNSITGAIAKNWFSKDGAHIDTLAMEISEMSGLEITPQDIIDFIIENPNGLRKTSDKAIAFARRFSEVATAKSGMRVGYPTSKTGREFLKAEQESREIDRIAFEKFEREAENYYFYQLLDIEGVDYVYTPTDEELQYYEQKSKYHGQISESQGAQGRDSVDAAEPNGEVSSQEEHQRRGDSELNEDDRRGVIDSESSQGGLHGSGAPVAQEETRGVGDLIRNQTEDNQNNNAEQREDAVRANNGQRHSDADNDSRQMAVDSPRKIQKNPNRGDIRVLEEGLGDVRTLDSDYSERDRQGAESERLIKIAKENNLFTPLVNTTQLGDKVPQRSGESVVYIDENTKRVFKVKNPYAKAALKNGVQPEDVIFEHQIHNLLFPETAYTLEDISEEYGDVRLVLSQDFIKTEGVATQAQITEALAKRGLYPEDDYLFGNDLVSVTDVEGDNVLLGEDGELYFIDPIIRFKQPAKTIINTLSTPTIGEAIEVAEAQTDTTPTEAQKEAGNYKKGHIQVGSFNISIEQPKGSVRSGVDANGKEWQVTMNNTYGYIRGTEGVDGDHIDVFLSSDIDGWNGRRVFVIDQYNPDGSFDEHKVMLGFNEADEAKAEYLKNYEQGWESSRKIVPTSVLIEDFEKWIDSSHRKTKPFAEYKSVKADTATKPVGYSVDKRFHKKNGTNIFAVKFTEQMPREQFTALKKSVKEFGGYYSSFGKGGFIFDAESDAHRFAQSVVGNTSTEQEQPLSIADMSESITIPEVEAQPVENVAPKSKWVAEEDADEFAKLRAAMRSKLGQLNSGIDPEVLAIGCKMSYLLMKNGVRKFHAYSTAMIEEIGEDIRPMLKSLYEATRYTPEVQDSDWSNELSTPDEVFKFNVATFDKIYNDPISTAEMVVAEQEAALQTKTANKYATAQANAKKKTLDLLKAEAGIPNVQNIKRKSKDISASIKVLESQLPFVANDNEFNQLQISIFEFSTVR